MFLLSSDSYRLLLEMLVLVSAGTREVVTAHFCSSPGARCGCVRPGRVKPDGSPRGGSAGVPCSLGGSTAALAHSSSGAEPSESRSARSSPPSAPGPAV